MSNPNQIDWTDFIAEWKRKMEIFTRRWVAGLPERLKDPVEGPILREKIMNFLQSGVKTAVTEDVARRQSATEIRRQRLRRWMHVRRRVEVTITLPKYLLQSIDGLAEAVKKPRSEVIEAFAEYCLDHEDIIDELFPR